MNINWHCTFEIIVEIKLDILKKYEVQRTFMSIPQKVFVNNF